MIVSLNKLAIGLKAEDLFKSIYECDDKDIRVMIKKRCLSKFIYKLL